MLQNITPVVKNLLIINVIVYFGATSLSQMMPDLAMYFPMSNEFSPYQIVTHFFMHGDTQHLIYNMLGLFFLGPMVEKTLGSSDFLKLYILSALGALLAHVGVGYYGYLQAIDQLPNNIDVNAILDQGRQLLLDHRNYSDPIAAKMNRVLNVPVVGASGAIYGVVIAFATLYPNTKLMLLFPPIPIKAKYLGAAYIAFDLYNGVMRTNTGIAHFAHLGGALTGFLLVKYFFGSQINRRL